MHDFKSSNGNINYHVHNFREKKCINQYINECAVQACDLTTDLDRQKQWNNKFTGGAL